MQGRLPKSSIIEFEDVLVIVGGGTVDAELLRELYASGARLVGADGGADLIAAAGLKPEAIIGDLDSLENPLGWLGRTRMVHLAEQETTDFEKAIYSTRAPVTIAIGMTGQRLDHTLAALDAVGRYAARRHIILVDEHDLALALTASFSFAVDKGERVSIHPLARVAFWRSEGLLYPLDAVTLAPGIRIGTSNAATDGPFTVVPEEGVHAPFLLILDRRHLLPLIAVLMGEARGRA